MTTINRDSGQTKRPAEDGEMVPTKQKKPKRGKSSAQPSPTLEHQPKSIITVRMPMNALSNDWKIGKNRDVDWNHVRALSKRFYDAGGPDKENPENYMAVSADLEDIQRMIESSTNPGEAAYNNGESLSDFTNWMMVNGGRQVEIIAGQHRKEALRKYVERARLGEEELWWPCKIYDPRTLTIEQLLQLRANRRDVARPDSHSDIWLQAVTAESQKENIFHGKVEDMMRQMSDILQLHDEAGVPLRRLVTLWRNERWKAMITQWCSTMVGRATFKISTWEWMISCRIDDFWFAIFRQVLNTLAELPGNAAEYVDAGDWEKMVQHLPADDSAKWQLQ
ncbi:hypothetical protein S40288_10412, partial [Stachybotrys chartarum IBT 40288]